MKHGSKYSARNILGASFFAFSALLLAGGSSAHAQASQPIVAAKAAVVPVVSETSKNVDVTIYGGYAQVEETRTVALSAGRNRIQLNGIASKYRPDSLKIISAKGTGAFTYESSTYQAATLTKEKLLQTSIGQQITIRAVDGAVNGKLVAYNGQQLVVQDDDGNTAIFSDSLPVVMPTPTGLSNSASLVVEADVAAAGDYTISFLYETAGLGWEANHTAIYDEGKAQLSSFESTVSLVNQSGTSFNNATIWLVTGSARARESFNKSAYSLDGPQAAMAPGAGIRSASAENLGEQKVYKLPGNINLSDGQSRLVPLFSRSDVKVVKEYFLPSSFYGYATESKQSVNARLNIVNSDKEHLGLPIPAGSVKVYQQNSAGRLQVVSIGSVSHVSKDESFSLSLGTASDVKAQTKLSAVKTLAKVAKDDSEFQDQTFTVTISNFKEKEDVSVKMEVNVPAAQDDVTPLIRDSAAAAHTNITAPAGGTGSFEYTLRVQTR